MVKESQMAKHFTEIIIDGFNSGETDFATRLQQSGMEQAFLDTIVSPVVDTMTSATETVIILVNGHSDRVDDAGLSREQRRVKELTASAERTDSAKAEVLRRVQVQLAAQGLAVAPQMSDRVQFVDISSGAAQLEKSGDILSNEDRRINRRVILRTLRFVP
jgi:hypothetical protein